MTRTQKIFLLAESVFAEIEAHAIEGYPNEVAGLLGRRGGSSSIVATIRLVNDEPDRPGTRFFVTDDALKSARHALAAIGLEEAGMYHSHPDQSAAPSWEDRARNPIGATQIIVSVERGKVREMKALLRVDRDITEALTVHPDPPMSEDTSPFVSSPPSDPPPR